MTINNKDDIRNQLEEYFNNLAVERRKRLLEVIQTNHLTYVELEKMIGVAKSSIQRYLTGETAKIPIDFFEKIALVTNTPVEYLTCLDKETNEKIVPINANQDDLLEVMQQLNEGNQDRVKEYANLLFLGQQSQAEQDDK